jgi:hypothetical protein
LRNPGCNMHTFVRYLGRLFQEGANGGQGTSFSFNTTQSTHDRNAGFLWSSSSYTPCGKIVVPVIKTEPGAPEAICSGPPNLQKILVNTAHF